MTLELKLEHLCTHLVVDEVSTLEADLKTVKTLRPLANSNSQVELKINGFLIEDVTNPTYGFRLVRNASSVDPTARMIQFRRLRRATDEYYQVTYYTRASECRRCHGLRIEQDYRYNINGTLLTVRNEQKLVQDMRKIVLTAIGSNIFHTWYGTSIPALIGAKITNASLIRSKMESDIRVAIRRYSDTQTKQLRALLNVPGASVDPRERFGQLLKLEVQQDVSEPTAYNIQIAFTNRSAELLTVDTTVALPDPVSLVYNTVQAGALDPQFQRTG